MLQIVPLFPANLVPVALALGAALQAAAGFLPESWRPYVWGLGALAWLLAGWGARLPAWLAGKPLLPFALAAPLLAAYELLETHLPTLLPMLPESLRGWAGFLYGVLALAAGKVLPAPIAVKKAAPVEGQPNTGSNLAAGESVTVAVDPTCSIYDRVRGLC